MSGEDTYSINSIMWYMKSECINVIWLSKYCTVHLIEKDIYTVDEITSKPVPCCTK